MTGGWVFVDLINREILQPLYVPPIGFLGWEREWDHKAGWLAGWQSMGLTQKSINANKTHSNQWVRWHGTPSGGGIEEERAVNKTCARLLFVNIYFSSFSK